MEKRKKIQTATQPSPDQSHTRGRGYLAWGKFFKVPVFVGETPVNSSKLQSDAKKIKKKKW